MKNVLAKQNYKQILTKHVSCKNMNVNLIGQSINWNWNNN